jgi:pyruvate/2-oxoglutarate dehydrogenase complex dihydrolipoamide dehydrogenase (E3) component
MPFQKLSSWVKPSGLLKVIIDAKSHEILGAHLYCVNSHEMINELKMAMDNHIKYEYLRDAIYTHPDHDGSL